MTFTSPKIESNFNLSFPTDLPTSLIARPSAAFSLSFLFTASDWRRNAGPSFASLAAFARGASTGPCTGRAEVMDSRVDFNPTAFFVALVGDWVAITSGLSIEC